jgi:hypothetical protein
MIQSSPERHFSILYRTTRPLFAATEAGLQGKQVVTNALAKASELYSTYLKSEKSLPFPPDVTSIIASCFLPTPELRFIILKLDGENREVIFDDAFRHRLPHTKMPLTLAESELLLGVKWLSTQLKKNKIPIENRNCMTSTKRQLHILKEWYVHGLKDMTSDEIRKIAIDYSDTNSLQTIVRRHPKLEELFLISKKEIVNKATLANLKNLPLKNLYVQGPSTNEILSCLRKSSLITLNLSGHSHVTDEGISYVTDFPLLQNLKLSVDSLTLESLTHHLKSCSSLRSLTLFNHAAVLKDLDWLTDLPQLEFFKIDPCPKLSDDVGMTILPNILNLDLPYTNSDTACLSRIAKKFPNLQQLSLTYYDNNLPNKWLVYLAELPYLRHLNLSNCLGLDFSEEVVLPN